MGTQTIAASTGVPADLIGDIATNAYIYAYPLILMELTRRIPPMSPTLDSSARRR